MDFTRLARGAFAAVCIFLLSGRASAAGPEIAQDQYCTLNSSVSSSQRCFNSLTEAENYLRIEPSPAVGRQFLVKVGATADLGKNYTIRYAVRDVPYEEHVGDTHEIQSTAFPYDCGVVNIVPGRIMRGCLSEQELVSGFMAKYMSGQAASHELTGQYIADPPPYWYANSTDSNGRYYSMVARNLLPAAEDRRLVVTRPVGQISLQIIKRSHYRCPALYSAPGRTSWETADNPWPNICSNYQQGTITKVSHQNKTCGDGVGNPCVTSTGNKEYREKDFTWEGVDFNRSYNSIRDMTLASGMNDNWAHTYSDRLRAPRSASADAYWQRSDGYYEGFAKVVDGVYRPWNSVGAVLYREPDATAAVDGRWRLVQQSGRVLRFDESGRLIRIEQGAKNYRLSYCTGDAFKNRLCTTPAGMLYQVVSETGRSLRFSYIVRSVQTGPGPADTSPMPLISSINADGIVQASYDYDNLGRLTHAALGDQALNQGRSYIYGEPSGLCKTASGAAVSGCDPVNFPHHLTSILDENGIQFARYTYDGYGRATSSEHAGGAGRVTLNYLPGGKVETTMPTGSVRKFEFNADAVRVATSVENVTTDGSATGPTQYAYSGTRLASSISALGIRTNFDYDDYRQVGRTEGLTAAGAGTALTRKTRSDWHSTLNRPTEQRVYNAADAVIAKDAWTYNARGQALTVSRIDPATNETRVTTTSYCEAADVAVPGSTCPVIGLIKSVDGPRTDINDITTYSYYPSDAAACATAPSICAYRKGDLWKVTNALGQIVLENLRYDVSGRVLSSIDANGVVTDTEYDARGQVAATKVRGANDAAETDDRITRVQYWPTGLVKKVTLPDAASIAYTYDAAQRLTDIADDAGNTIHYTLNAAGEREKEDTKTASGTLKRTLSRVYDQLGRLKANKDASQNATLYSYDADGHPDRTTDALGRIADQDHDALGRLRRSLQDVGGLNVETKFDYDPLDRMTKVTDPKGLDTVYTYNGFGDQTRLSSPDTGITDYTYNAAGLVATKKDANDPEPHRYTYDALNRPKTVSYTAAGGPDVEYDYDTVNSVCTAGETFALGRVTAMRTDGTELKYCYDRFGQVARKVQTIDGKSLTLRYAYTLGGQVSSMTYPDGAVADYIRDSQGRVKEIGVTPAGGVRTVLLNGATYEPFGPVAGWTYGNGRTLTRTYDQDYRAKSIHDPSPGGLSLHYGYNAVGELTELKDGLQSATLAKYDYDALSRLTITRDGPTGTPLETYGYDATGNRTSLLHAGVTDAYTYPADSHRLASVAGVGRAYDAVGNTTSIGGAAKEFVYGANGRMTQVKQGGVVKAGYRYNALGERVAVVSGAGTSIDTHTLYDEAGNWVADYDAIGNPKQQMAWIDGAPVGVLTGGVAQKPHYIEHDHLGAPRAVIDPIRNASIWIWNIKSEAFGGGVPNQDYDQDGTGFVFDMRFPGQRFDSFSGLNYNYFRDYDTSLGRYIQSDPIGLRAGPSTYSYVDSNPFGYIDPFGLVRWAGTTYSVSARVAMWARYQLRSECVNGISYLVEVEASSRNWSFGAPLAFTGMHISFEDGLSYVDPNVFNGAFAYFGVGFGFPVLANYSTTSLGRAVSLPSMTYGLGYEADAGYAIGGSHLNWAIPFRCDCLVN